MTNLWSGRFDTAPDAAAFDFGASFRFDRRLFEDDVTGSAAWARALRAAGVLTAAEAATVKAQVTAFNQVIAASASSAGATLVDINALFTSVATNGLTVNGLTVRNGFLGGVFSLDGIHPTNTGYAVIANAFIDAMNANIKLSIPDVNLIPIAAADLLFPPYPGHHTVGPTGQPHTLQPITLQAESAREILGKQQ